MTQIHLPDLQPNEWHFLTVSVGDQGVRVYVDGQATR